MDKVDLKLMEYKILGNLETKGLIDILSKLLFQCAKCGSCCNSTFFDYIPLFHFDVTKILKNLRWNRNKLREICETREYEGQKLLHIKQPCPFFKDNNCNIYEFRPKACRDFPIYIAGDTYRILNCCKQAEKLFSEIVKELDKSRKLKSGY